MRATLWRGLIVLVTRFFLPSFHRLIKLPPPSAVRCAEPSASPASDGYAVGIADADLISIASPHCLVESATNAVIYTISQRNRHAYTVFDLVSNIDSLPVAFAKSDEDGFDYAGADSQCDEHAVVDRNTFSYIHIVSDVFAFAVVHAITKPACDIVGERRSHAFAISVSFSGAFWLSVWHDVSANFSIFESVLDAVAFRHL